MRDFSRQTSGFHPDAAGQFFLVIGEFTTSQLSIV